MNQREPTAAPIGAGQALPCLALLLLSLLVAVRAWSRPLLSGPAAIVQTKPYLVALGAPPLRFQEIAPPPDLVTRPPAAAPPVPATADSETSPPNTTSSQAPAALPVSTPVENTDLPSTAEAATEETPAPVRTPPEIIRDELRPQARPEDFLPFFQIPVSQPSDVNVVVPVPRTPATSTPLPLSSATYTQTPR